MIELTKSKFLDFIPSYVINVAEELQKNNFEAFLVGGSIRDILLGKNPGDYDIATNAMPDDVVKIFPKSIPTGAQFGTITVVTADEEGETHDIEVTTYRLEADYVGGRWPSKVDFARTIEEDLSRRDFTINAIALNLQEFDNPETSIQEVLVDPFSGYKDMQNKIIRAVRDPLERLSEDGLRAVRACRLASQLDFEIEESTFNAIKETNHVTEKVAVERFREELEKLIYRSPKPSIGMRLLKESGILKLFIPELLEGIDITQPEFHVDDVFEHSIKTLDIAEDDIKLAALFHDIGKPRCISKDDKGTHFYGHDKLGAEMVKEIMTRLRFSKAQTEEVANLVRWHMFYYPSGDWRKSNLGAPNVAPEDKDLHPYLTGEHAEVNPLGWSDGAIRRFIANVGGDDQMDKLMKLRIADAGSNPKAQFNPKEVDVLSQRVAEVRAKDMALKVSDLDITGKDLMEAFKIEAGPKLGEILNYLLQKVLDEPLLNKKEELLKLTEDYLHS